MKNENQKTKEDTQAEYAEFLYDVLEKIQKGQIIFAQAVYLIDEAAKVKYVTLPAQESSDAVELKRIENRLEDILVQIAGSVKGWVAYNMTKDLQSEISIYIKDKHGRSWQSDMVDNFAHVAEHKTAMEFLKTPSLKEIEEAKQPDTVQLISEMSAIIFHHPSCNRATHRSEKVKCTCGVDELKAKISIFLKEKGGKG